MVTLEPILHKSGEARQIIQKDGLRTFATFRQNVFNGGQVF